MEISVNLSEADIDTLDQYAAQAELSSRSAALRQAIRLLHTEELTAEYVTAYAEWDQTVGSELWGRAATSVSPEDRTQPIHRFLQEDHL
ncbi:MAG: ribbon-helix-helix domain-containing protein [Ancrocorticia sp.]|uniref:ribbon-helix-helix domain-containing protein n=1 Tax=Ancrocorticia sp. TaxID=2593684 RepID=UPI003F8F24ED